MVVQQEEHVGGFLLLGLHGSGPLLGGLGGLGGLQPPGPWLLGGGIPCQLLAR